MNPLLELAERLSEAQRDTIESAWAYPDFHRNGEQVSFCPIWRNDSSRRALERKRLIASMAEGGPRLTPLGIELRDYLRALAANPRGEGEVE